MIIISTIFRVVITVEMIIIKTNTGHLSGSSTWKHRMLSGKTALMKCCDLASDTCMAGAFSIVHARTDGTTDAHRKKTRESERDTTTCLNDKDLRHDAP
jgi:hypothetical protein